MKRNKQEKAALVTLLVGAGLALVASFVLSIEALILAGNKNAALSCSVNAVINCASVAKDPSATLLGFPNSFIGMAALPVMITIAVALLMGGKLPKLFMQLAQAGVIFGLIFALWMLYMSFSVIQVLCPWCLATDLGILMIVFGITRYNILKNNLSFSAQARNKTQKFVEKDYDLAILIGIIVAIIAAILAKYGANLFN